MLIIDYKADYIKYFYRSGKSIKLCFMFITVLEAQHFWASSETIYTYKSITILEKTNNEYFYIFGFVIGFVLYLYDPKSFFQDSIKRILYIFTVYTGFFFK